VATYYRAYNNPPAKTCIYRAFWRQITKSKIYQNFAGQLDGYTASW